MTIDEWMENIHSWAEDRGFWERASPAGAAGDIYDDYYVSTKLMLTVAELGEAVEALRKGDRTNFIEELADAVIRIFDLSGAMQFDLPVMMKAKMETNEGRPYKHGKRF